MLCSWCNSIASLRWALSYREEVENKGRFLWGNRGDCNLFLTFWGT
jgi:hypothetical protein